MQLSGKSALVTGGGRGIGREIAVAFAREGANVCILSRSPGELDNVLQEIQALGRRGLAVTCDVANREDVERAVEALIGQFGKVDVLVNNAGGGFERKLIGDDDPENWLRVVEINLLGTYYCCRAILPHMKRNGGGSIINVGSGMGHQPRQGNSSYNVAKAGQWMLTQCLAMEVWQDNILVNELVPGPVYTQLTENIFSPAKPHPIIASEWVKSPQDVVPLVLLLASQPPQGPTGQSFSLARRPI